MTELDSSVRVSVGMLLKMASIPSGSLEGALGAKEPSLAMARRSRIIEVVK